MCFISAHTVDSKRITYQDLVVNGLHWSNTDRRPNTSTTGGLRDMRIQSCEDSEVFNVLIAMRMTVSQKPARKQCHSPPMNSEPQWSTRPRTRVLGLWPKDGSTYSHSTVMLHSILSYKIREETHSVALGTVPKCFAITSGSNKTFTTV